MKVKVGDRTYDGEKEPVMAMLSKDDKRNITNMLPETEKYCSYPDTEEWTGNHFRKIRKWMGI